MKNYKILVIIMISILALFITLIIIQMVENRNTLNVNDNQELTTTTTEITDTATTQATATQQVQAELNLDAFDKSIKNSTDFNSKIIAANGKIFYLIDYMLYCYDTNINEIVFSEEVPESYIPKSGIYLLDGYIYYMEGKTINRINADTLEVEEFLDATDVLIEISGGSRPDNSRDEYFSYFLLNENIIIVRIIYGQTMYGTSGPMIVYGAANVDDFIFKRLYLSGLNEFNPALYESKIIMGNFQYIDISKDVEAYETIEYLFDGQDIELDEKSVEGLVFAGDYMFTCEWPYSSMNVYGVDCKTGNLILEDNVDSAFVSMHGLNQYVIYYYYDRLELEEFNAAEGAVIFDVNNQIIFRNEEINDIISGDIDNYLDLINMEFCIDGDIVYAMKRRQELIISPTYTEDGEYHPAEIVDVYKYQDKYIDFSETRYLDNIADEVNLYKVEIIDGKFHFTLLYKEFD